MSGAQPSWRRAFDRAERELGGRLEAATGSPRFLDALLPLWRAQRAALRLLDRQTRAALHLAGLPARADVARVNRQLVALRAEVRELTARLEERERR